MAFFKFPKGADDPVNAPAKTISIEVIRQRAKYRLAGAAVLVLAGVICLPLLLDSQPRPVAVNTPIEIPDKNKMPALAFPAPAVSPAVTTPVGTAASAVKPAASKPLLPAADILTESAEPAKAASGSDKNRHPAQSASALAASKSGASTAVNAAASAASKAIKAASREIAGVPSPAALSKASEAARVQAVLDGAEAVVQPKAAQTKVSAANAAESEPTAATEGRFVVQIGAFADAARAHEVRLKVEQTGLKTYTHVADTKEGKRIRVRVGPYSTRAEAEKSAEKIKKLSLPAAILTL
ncbi:MAG: SPOR domain-containing protein [Comamonadaceae bacterium]|nr:SPOR domain-containing protein [Comamonadaceae bacterium]